MKRKAGRGRTVGDEIIAGLEEALAYERGDLENVKVTRATLATQSADVAPAPAYGADRIASLRERLQLSQPVFAAALNVSPETVKKWEQGRREPDGAALRLLELVEDHPQWIIDLIGSLSRSRASATRAAPTRPAKGSSRALPKSHRGGTRQ